MFVLCKQFRNVTLSGPLRTTSGALNVKDIKEHVKGKHYNFFLNDCNLKLNRQVKHYN